MGIHKTPVTGIRIPDKNVLEKLSVIAEKNRRSRTKEIEVILTNFVEEYEKENGSIILKKEI